MAEEGPLPQAALGRYASDLLIDRTPHESLAPTEVRFPRNDFSARPREGISNNNDRPTKHDRPTGSVLSAKELH